MAYDDLVFQRLLKERIISSGPRWRTPWRTLICAQMMLLLAAEDPERDIYLYINSPGGSISAGMAIYDIDAVRPQRRRNRGDGTGCFDGQFLLSSASPASGTACRTPDHDAPAVRRHRR